MLVLGLTLLVASTASARLMLRPNPANDPVLVKKKLDPKRYHGPDRCRSKPTRGIRKLIRWMKQNTKRNTPYGTIRSDGMHCTGRALDWMLDARKRPQRRKAKRVINTWMAKDKRGRNKALARRMGIQMIIYNCRIWGSYGRGWSTYGACRGTSNPDPTQAHKDHIHIEIHKRAARLRTTFWRFQSQLGGSSGGGGGGISAG